MTDKEKSIYLAQYAAGFEIVVGCKLFFIHEGETLMAKEFLERVKND